MSAIESVSPRDLRTRGREILDAVEQGRTFNLTRDGHEIGQLVPIRRKRVFVSREDFVAMSAGSPAIDLERFRRDQDAAVDGYLQ